MCPPGADQTCRTPQRWYVVSPATHQNYALFDYQKSGKGVRDFLKGDESWDAFWKLVKPSSIFGNTTLSEDILPKTGKLSSVELLPAEIISMILLEPDLSRENKLAFGICSKTLWTHLIAHVQQDARSTTSHWANTPLVCTGTWLKDLPKSIYTAYPATQELEQEYQLNSRYWDGPCPARMWNYDQIRDRVEHDSRQTNKAKWLSALQAVRKSVPPCYMPKLQDSLVAASTDPAFWAQRNWILRNQNTKQFFRVKLDQPRRSQEPKIYVRTAPWLSLDQALILRICWGFANWGGIRGSKEAQDLELTRGEWAGHRFDVVEDGSFGTEQWQDVTDAIIEEGRTWVQG